jgi:sugar phosphate isomerase/epimerase
MTDTHRMTDPTQQIDRREFLRATASAAAAVALGGAACSRAPESVSTPRAFALDAVGLQLYTVRALMQQSVDGTLEQVARAGYRNVETAGTYNLQPAAFRELLGRHGLRSPSGHYPLEQAENGQALATARALGQTWVVVPSVPANLHGSRAAYAELAERFNRIGDSCRAAGLRFAYHNHNFEFETYGESAPAYDVLLARTNPALVWFELDAYWAYKAGYDPASYFERFPGRFSLLHVKDGTAPPARAMVDVGRGVIDFRRMFALSRPAGLRYAFVEHDQPGDALASIRASYEHLARLLGDG